MRYYPCKNKFKIAQRGDKKKKTLNLIGSNPHAVKPTRVRETRYVLLSVIEKNLYDDKEKRDEVNRFVNSQQ